MKNNKINLTSILLIILIISVIIMTVVMIVINKDKSNNSNNDTNNTANTQTDNTDIDTNTTNTNTPNTNTPSTNTNTSNTSSNIININDYVGMWYDINLKEEGSDICIGLDANNNVVLSCGIHRTAVLEETIVNVVDNKISFDDGNGFTGTITLGDKKITLNYSVENYNIENEELEFAYKKERTSTQNLAGYDLAGNWEPKTATRNGKEISLQEIYGTGISYGGYLTLNSDNTYSRFIGITSDELTNDLTGTYEVKANNIIFTTNNGNKEEAKFDMGTIAYDYGDGVIVKFYPEN